MARNTYNIDESLETPFDSRHIKRSFVYIKNYARQMIISLILSVAASVVGLLGPVLIQKAIDEAIPEKNIPLLLILTLLLGGTIVVSIVFTVIRSRLMAHVAQGIVRDIRADLFAHLQELPFSYFDNRPQGKILVRVVSYVNNVSDMLSNGLINIIIEIINIVLIAGFMIVMDLKLALIIIAGLPLLFTVIMFLRTRQRRAFQELSNKNSNLSAYLCESIDGVKVTQSFTREEINLGIFNRLSFAQRKCWMRAMKIANLVWYSTENISQLVISLMYIGALIWFSPAASVGVIIAMGNYASRFWQPLLNLANLYNSVINTVSYLERIFETIDEPVEIADAPDACPLQEITGQVEFKNVSFEYEKGTRVLDDVSFKIEPGQSVALVGPTGSGKSTIVNLISRFYNITSGEVLIDGHNINNATLRSLRSQMGIMLQDSFIFSGTIEDNIRYGRLDASIEEIEKSCAAVCADEFIREFPDGYTTVVNERGGRLSQGQKQLISFARTLLADPKILILDEATSSIDARTERLLQNGIKTLLEGRTSFIIAHRLSTIQSCDLILFIDHGRIIEAGTHKDLIARKGRYYELSAAQGQVTTGN